MCCIGFIIQLLHFGCVSPSTRVASAPTVERKRSVVSIGMPLRDASVGSGGTVALRWFSDDALNQRVGASLATPLGAGRLRVGVRRPMGVASGAPTNGAI